MSNPLDPEMMSPAERLAEAASLLARGILRSCIHPTVGVGLTEALLRNLQE